MGGFIGSGEGGLVVFYFDGEVVCAIHVQDCCAGIARNGADLL